MARNGNSRIRDAAEAVLGPGEQVMSSGQCWAVQLRERVPLLFLGRRQYLVALTDRRVLVFERSRRGPTPRDLILGKRYESFTIDRVKRHRPLLQVVMEGTNGNRLVLEFRPRQRELAGELIARLTPRRDTPAPAPSPATAPQGVPAVLPTKGEAKRAKKAQRKQATKGAKGQASAPPPEADRTDPVIDSAFWDST